MIPWTPGSRVGHVVDSETGCWVWTGAVSTGGYARVGIPGSRLIAQAHRVYYRRAKGEIPPGLDLDHLCRNRRCVNPEHLEPVTRAVNSWRGNGCKMTPEKVREMRERWRAGGITQLRLAAEYGIDGSVVSDICMRRTWREVSP